MSIYSSAVKKPITTIMVFMAVIVFGLYSLKFLPIDLYPEIDPPFVTVMTTYVGANAEEIETNITTLVEDRLNSIDDLKELTSSSQDNLSMVTLEIEWETDLTKAVNNVRDALDVLKEALPDEAESPMIFRFSTSSMPILFYAISADESYDGLDKLLEDKIINPLNRINGIGSIATMGAPGRRIYVDCDPRKLDAFGITIEQIGQVIGAENMNLPSGHLKMGQFDYQLRIEGELTDSYQLDNIVVGNKNGKIVYLKDVALISDTYREKEIQETFKGKPGMRLFVMKQSGANSVKIAAEVEKELAILQKDLPDDVEFITIFNTADNIKTSINNLSTTLLFAFIAVIFVVLLFLGRWRATFIIVLTIPISLIVAFIYLYMSGNSINVISLASLSIAIGMVVDDAIVVLENITKHIERGSSPREAAIYATKEVWLSVVATTLVVVAVFLPLTLVGGQTGVMFQQLGWIVTITVVTSTLAAITLTPMLSAKMLRLRETTKESIYDKTIKRALDGLDDAYARFIAWCLHHKTVIIISSILIFVASMLLVSQLKFENFPQTDDSFFQIDVELQTGMRVEESQGVADEIQEILNDKVPEMLMSYVSAGTDDEGGFNNLMFQSATNTVMIRVKLSPIKERERSVWEIQDMMRLELDKIPEIINFTIGQGNFGMSTSNTVDVEIFGYDIPTTTLLANEIKGRLEAIEGAGDVQISRDKEKPQLQIVFDRDKLAQYGLNTATAAVSVRNRVSGLVASQYRENGDEYDIVVRYEEEGRNTIADLKNISIMTPMGTLVKVSEVGRVEEYWAPPSIDRKSKQRVVTVSATPTKGVALSDLAIAVQSELDQVNMPSGVRYRVGGAFEDMMETVSDLALLLVVIVLLVFIVMASQFESFRMPFIIMLSLFFSFSGVVLALFFTDTTMSTVAMLGAILLVGIVVKNGIVMIDYMNLLRERGVELYEAVVMGCRSRLRPILMTALTTILGMLPMALSVSVGSEIWAPRGIT
ncbi:MAG: efflux RND transporter permease subunit, partial [Bacteroidales bacterium]|nr:efflux RND transporter permease subunit [Bacteroidales bacterium]